jgi:hypothetical protein
MCKCFESERACQALGCQDKVCSGTSGRPCLYQCVNTNHDACHKHATSRTFSSFTCCSDFPLSASTANNTAFDHFAANTDAKMIRAAAAPAPPATSAVPSAASCSSTIAIAVDQSGVVENSTCALAAGTRLCPCAVTNQIVAVHSHHTDTSTSTLSSRACSTSISHTPTLDCSAAAPAPDTAIRTRTSQASLLR